MTLESLREEITVLCDNNLRTVRAGVVAPLVECLTCTTEFWVCASALPELGVVVYIYHQSTCGWEAAGTEVQDCL